MSHHKIVQLISAQTSISKSGVEKTIQLLEGGATIPFIARYRKEHTGSLDEVELGAIKKGWEKLNELIKRRVFILKTIDESGQLTDALSKQISSCWDETILEDLYLPFKKKRKTRASVARGLGLEPLANDIFNQQLKDVDLEARKYIKEGVENVEAVLKGARDIIAERISEDPEARTRVRKLFKHEAMFHAKVVKSKQKEGEKYKDYFDYHEPAKKAAAHRVLAINRAEQEGFLRVKLNVDDSQACYLLQDLFLVNGGSFGARNQMKQAIEDCFNRLLGSSIETEFRKLYKDKADEEAIRVFSENLKQLLLAPPLGAKRILGLDPGFRTGCKLVCLDEQGNLKSNAAIYPNPPQNKYDESKELVLRLVNKYKIEAIAIGNGTASKETYSFVKSLPFENPVEIFMVNESGASIYSASEIARNEFPDYDITVRGAVSIARRLMDPLSELVKIDAKSIGVGQYQHDVNQKKLKLDLDQCVENSVNKVGINLNTASEHLLSYVSGLGPVLAKNIVNHRAEHGAFKTIQSLKKVPRMGAKAFEQSAGFLRIRDAKNALDNTGVHPERYALVKQIAKDQHLKVEELIQSNELKSIQLSQYVSNEVGMPTLKDVIKELEKPGLDPRGAAATFEFTPGINEIEDVKEGMMVKGIINNVTKFGAFVDIGIKESGLIHVSQLANRFVSDPLEVVKLNQEVHAKVIEVDVARKRISLSLKN